MTLDYDPSSPPPTQPMVKPATRENLRNGLLLGLSCLGVFGLGMVMWVWGMDSLVGSGSLRTQDNAFIILLASPLMLPAALYFFYTTARDWRRSARFRQGKQDAEGIITHLWINKDSSRKRYRVGYKYGNGHTAYQDVTRRRFDSLAVGDRVGVIYLPDDPHLGYFEAHKHKSKRKKKEAEP